MLKETAYTTIHTVFVVAIAEEVVCIVTTLF